MSNLSEIYKVDIDVLGVTSAAGATSKWYDMEGYDRAMFVIAAGTFTLSAATVQIYQSADVSGATNAVISGATLAMGNTTAAQFDHLSKFVITCASAATDNDAIGINGVTLTNSTAGATTASSLLGFGSSDGATGAGGTTAIANSLASKLNSSGVGLSSILIAATQNSTEVLVQLRDGAGTYLSATGHANFPITAQNQLGVLEIHADELASTGRYISARITTATTGQKFTITCIRSGRYNPFVQGKSRKSS